MASVHACVALDSAFDIPGRWIVCHECGETATMNTRGARRRYCSQPCARRAMKRRRSSRDAAGVDWLSDRVRECCAWCFGDMQTYAGRGAPSHRFCGATCRGESERHRVTHPEGRCDLRWLKCLTCGSAFHSYRASKFCSRRCNEQDKRRRQLAERGRAGNGWRIILCAWCGKSHETRNGVRCCSTSCASNLRKSERPGGWVCPMPAPPTTPVHYWNCEHCGRTAAGRRKRRFCTEWCRHAAAGRLPDRTEVTIDECKVCGKVHCRPASRGAKFCSARCAKRERRGRRKQDKKGLVKPTLRRKVLERDGWRCHLCGKKIPDRPFKARPNDGTVDHLVPRSAGGGNEMSNLAAAHFLCNSKRCTDGAAQLRLIG